LPHDGRGIARDQVFHALTNGLKLHVEVANRLVDTTFRDLEIDQRRKYIRTFNLDELNKHGLIEHDGSFSRDDAALGDNQKFDPVIFKTYLQEFGDATETNLATAGAARHSRVVHARTEHLLMNKEFKFGLEDYIISVGETVLLLAVLGDPKEGKVPLQYLKVLFRKWFLTCLEDFKLTVIIAEERFPHNEGWRPVDTDITQSDIEHMVFGVIGIRTDKVAEELGEQIREFGFLKGVREYLNAYCNVM